MNLTLIEHMLENINIMEQKLTMATKKISNLFEYLMNNTTH